MHTRAARIASLDYIEQNLKRPGFYGRGVFLITASLYHLYIFLNTLIPLLCPPL